MSEGDRYVAPRYAKAAGVRDRGHQLDVEHRDAGGENGLRDAQKLWHSRAHEGPPVRAFCSRADIAAMVRRRARLRASRRLPGDRRLALDGPTDADSSTVTDQPVRVHMRVPGTAPMPQLMRLIESIETAGFDG